jgi:hypothetical protein
MDRRRFLKVTAAGALGALAAPASTSAAHARETTVFVGGPIHSMTRRGRLSAIAINGGRIVAVDDAARFLLRLGTRRLDLRGRALYPGFIDAHSHWYGDFERAADANPAGLTSPRARMRSTRPWHRAGRPSRNTSRTRTGSSASPASTRCTPFPCG